MNDNDRAVKLTIRPQVPLHQVSRYLYGNFAEHLGRCIYQGIWVGEDSKIKNIAGIRHDTTEALKNLALPALRWPGGCFADNYHWMDGIGPRKERPKRYNLWWHQPESNEFGTDEFMQLCNMIDTQPYICVNVGSGTVEEARSWVEYCNASQDTTLANLRARNGHADPYKVQFWGIGNENWGCGGNMRPEYYADLYRRFATYVRATAGEGAQLIACGSHPEIPEWDERFLAGMKGAIKLVDSIALHIYLGGGTEDIAFSDEDYYRLIASISTFERELPRAISLANAYSKSDHKIGVVLDEWGTWFRQATVEAGLYQQNTMRDALFTAASFHCFHDLGETLWMTNMAQTINVLQALILTRGPEMLKTPTYHIYEMFQPHRDAYLAATVVDGNPVLSLPDRSSRHSLSHSATISSDGSETFISLVNLHLADSLKVTIAMDGGAHWRISEVRQLATGDIHSHNTFDQPDQVKPRQISDVSDLNDISIPPQSITTLRLIKEH